MFPLFTHHINLNLVIGLSVTDCKTNFRRECGVGAWYWSGSCWVLPTSCNTT